MAKLKSAKDKLLKKPKNVGKKVAYNQAREKVKKEKDDIEKVEEFDDEQEDVEAIKSLNKKKKSDMRNEIRYNKRFEILERDNFTCQYCGRSREKYPDIELTVDHKIPLSKGGSNDDHNLITACYDCNEGKKDRLLDKDKDAILDKINKPEVQKIIDNGLKNTEIREYMASPKSEHNRKLLYQFNKEEGEDCPFDCESCMTVNDNFLSCFEMLKEHVEDSEDSDDEEQVIKANSVRSKIHLEENSMMMCNGCYLADRCKHYSMNDTCVYDFTSGIDFTDPEVAYKILIKAQSERVMRGLHFEKIDGGVADKNVTTEVQIMMDMLKQYEDRNKKGFNLQIGISGQSNMPTQGTGESIIGKIFGGLMNANKQIDGQEQVKALSKETESANFEIIPNEVNTSELEQKQVSVNKDES
jgi:hypothetical protein